MSNKEKQAFLQIKKIILNIKKLNHVGVEDPEIKKCIAYWINELQGVCDGFPSVLFPKYKNNLLE